MNRLFVFFIASSIFATVFGNNVDDIPDLLDYGMFDAVEAMLDSDQVAIPAETTQKIAKAASRENHLQLLTPLQQ